MSATDFHPLNDAELAIFLPHAQKVLDTHLKDKDKHLIAKLAVQDGRFILNGGDQSTLLVTIANIWTQHITLANVVIPEGKDQKIHVFQFTVIVNGLAPGIHVRFLEVERFPFPKLIDMMQRSLIS